MNARDIAYGYGIGYNDGLNASGGGEVDTPDPDYQQWLDLPEPNNNQAVFLIRLTDITTAVSLTVNTISSPSNYDDAFSVDWGDGGDLEMFASAPTSVSHTYSATGDYVVTFTNILGHNNFVKPTTDSYIIMAKYGDDMCAHFVNSTVGAKKNNFKSCTNLRYIKLPPTAEFNTEFFRNCGALRKIEFNGTINNLYSYMFYGCFNLDFSTLKFGDITEIPTYCFMSCYALKNISLPVCTSIGIRAFTTCYYLKSVSLPACTSVGNYVFANCYNLKTFTAASNCTYGTACFAGCYKLSPPDETEY